MSANPFGYARVSTDDQELALQIAALERHGVDAIFSEHASGKTVKRKKLELVIKLLRRGDTLVVWKLDRLGRDLAGVLDVIKGLSDDGVNLVSLTEQFDTHTPMGKAFLQIALVFAELERNMISERTREGMAAAKAAGQTFGRKPLIWKGDRGSVKRLARLQKMDDAGTLRRWVDDPDHPDGGVWVLIPSAQAVADDLNKPRNRDKDDKDIVNPETVRRWTRKTANGADWAGLKPKEV